MSDFDTEPQDVPVDVPAPSEAPPPPADHVEGNIARGRQTALTQLAKEEDISKYVQEKEDQEAYFDRGEELDERRDAEWFRRAHKALKDAELEAQGIKLNEQGEPEAPPPPPPGYLPADQVESMLDQERKTAAARVRIDQHFGSNAERKEQITQWHQAMDPQNKVAQWVIETETPFAPQIMERLADNPEALQEIASMPSRQRDRVLGMLEGKIAVEQRYAEQMRGQQQQWAQERRTTQAPPPIRPPRGGGANPPSDLHALASRGENVSDYVRLREQMERKSRG